ncbi:hypothetical protein PQX77_012088 [Marasmius sp. AFHP31]|nr:hypothetical protein PQX77_012088 [Marasmius sp. AFHP31]
MASPSGDSDRSADKTFKGPGKEGKVLHTEVQECCAVLSDVDAATFKVANASARLPEAQSKLNTSERSLKVKEQALGVEALQEINHLKTSVYIKKRMNVMALKELVLNEHRVDSQISVNVKRRDPGIQQLARQYNNLCKELRKLIESRKAPCNAITPCEIPMDQLFALDVDDNIWQNIRLGEEYDDKEVPPPWLADDVVREGIWEMLECDRSKEEIARLKWERDSMQEWFAEEWDLLTNVLLLRQDDANVSYQLEDQKKSLL